MTGRDFLDTNILVYAFAPERSRAEVAETLLADSPCISVQGLNELVNVLRRRHGFNWAELDEVSSTVQQLCQVRPLTAATHRLALQIGPRYQTSWWDALQLASALESGADCFWSEDLQHGQLVERQMRICNPFLAA